MMCGIFDVFVCQDECVVLYVYDQDNCIDSEYKKLLIFIIGEMLWLGEDMEDWLEILWVL